MGFNKKTMISVGIQTGIATVVAIGIAISQGLSFDGAAYENCGYLSDGFFISAVMFGGVGALLWISATGFFDIFGYAVKSLALMFASQKRVDAFPRYYEYKCEQAAKREGKASTASTLVAGLIVLALSFIMLGLYMALTPAGVS